MMIIPLFFTEIICEYSHCVVLLSVVLDRKGGVTAMPAAVPRPEEGGVRWELLGLEEHLLLVDFCGYVVDRKVGLDESREVIDDGLRETGA